MDDEPMRDDLREELATLGQRLEMAEFERRLAMARVQDLMSAHGRSVSLDMAAELTTLTRAALAAMLPGHSPSDTPSESRPEGDGR
jgi:hypothetical protein